MIKQMILLVFIGVVTTKTEAQSYKTAAGLRIGNDVSLSLSQRIFKKTTLDLYHQAGLFSGHNITTLAIKGHFPLLSKRLNVFAGVGPHFKTNVTSQYIENKVEPSSSFGLSIPLGMDFTIGRLNIGYDYMPAVKIIGAQGQNILTSSSALTLRYVIIKQDNIVKRTKARFKKKKR